MKLHRREFLQYSLALAGQSAMGLSARADTLPIYEGIYTGKFTYRSGVDAIDVHLSLLDFTSVDVAFKHLDGPNIDDVVAVYTVPVDDTQVSSYAGFPTGGVGIHGPQFPVRISLDTAGLAPGIYEVSIDPNVLRPENRESYSSGACVVSLHHVSRFVVTPPTPGSHGNILWIHDSLAATAYGGFGLESIYGNCGSSESPVVSFARPGLDRGTDRNKWVLRKLRDDDGHLFEHIDAVDFAEQPASYTENYDLIVACGQFEYLSHGFLANLEAHIDAGRNLLLCANEFATFRVRLDAATSQMTTYKHEAPFADPVGGAERAGVGMLIADTVWESELAGTTIWGALDLGGPQRFASTMTNLADTGWLFEGTNFQSVIPAFINRFCVGNSGVMLPDARFDLIDPARSRTDPDTVVWAATPAPEALKWWEAQPGASSDDWPRDPDGHALCTWREGSNGARIIGMPSQSPLQNFFQLPEYKRLFENIFQYLSVPGSAPFPSVPSLGLASRGLLTTALVGAGSQLLRKRDCGPRKA